MSIVANSRAAGTEEIARVVVETGERSRFALHSGRLSMGPRRTHDLRIRDVRPLIPPAILVEEIPISEAAANLVAETRAALTRIIHGQDRRLLAIVGPCSIHDPAAALDYGARLKRIADRLSDHVVVVMRAYFEKPRT